MEARESCHPSAMLQVDLTCEGHLIAEPFGINQRNDQVQKDLRSQTVQRFKGII